VGKTASAVALAGPLGGHIVSADAMQVYQGMDVGTAKPTRDEQALATHHLIDVVKPDEPFDAACFVSRARPVIERLDEKGVPIFIVGGTGLYIKALLHGLFDPGGNGHRKEVRERLEAEKKSLGPAVLYDRLCRVDPATGAKLHPNDIFRVIRALEVYESTGRPISVYHRQHGFSDRPYRVLKIGLYMDRQRLYERIDRRVEQMLGMGLLGEVQTLLNQGYGRELKSMSSIGYRHMAMYLRGELSWDDAVKTLKRDTRRYAKRQLTWFRADSEIKWVEPDQIEEKRQEIRSFLTT
jgi:tRNA dimethylallyltransferase